MQIYIFKQKIKQCFYETRAKSLYIKREKEISGLCKIENRFKVFSDINCNLHSTKLNKSRHYVAKNKPNQTLRN